MLAHSAWNSTRLPDKMRPALQPWARLPQPGFLGTLDRIKRVVRLGVFMVASGNAVDQPAVANGASDLLRDVFGEENMAVRSVIGVASLPLGVPIELEIIFELNE